MAIGRPRQFDAEKSINLAKERFWQGGYAATSLQDLLESMRLSKSSLYQSFGNKEQLFVRCLEEYRQQIDTSLNERLQQADSGLTFIRNLLAMVVDEAGKPQRKGCLLVNTANESIGNEPVVAQAVKRGFQTIEAILKQALQKARDDGELAIDVDVEELADLLVAAISGLRTMVRAGVPHARLEKVANILIESLK